MFVGALRHIRRLGRRGDTIVEVLLAMVVISSMLGGAFVVANKSLIASRDSQERGVALKLAEGQLERLKMLSESNPSVIFGNLNTFCIKTNNTVVATPDAGCKISSGATYQISITRSNAGSIFTAVVSWDKSGSDGTNYVRLYYMVYGS
jgi:Tfp pilus assembly protein PilV